MFAAGVVYYYNRHREGMGGAGGFTTISELRKKKALPLHGTRGLCSGVRDIEK